MRKISATLLAIFLFATGSWSSPLNNSYWKIRMSDNTNLLLKLSFGRDKFMLASRERSSKNIVGGKYVIARLSGKIKSHCIEISGKYRIANDTTFLSGEYKSLTSTQTFTGYITGDSIKAALSKNFITGTKTNGMKPLKDYPSIALMAADTTEKYLFNPNLVKGKEWQYFKKTILERSKKVVDDYEFEKMFNFRVAKLPFTHYGISVNPPKQSVNPNLPEAKPATKSIKFEIKKLSSNTVLFNVKTFSASAAEITPYIDSLKAMSISNLIIDLRNNGGGTIASALPLARYLVKDTLLGGIFLTQKYFKQHTRTPNLDEYANFPLFSEASFPLIINGIHNQKGLCLIVYPDTVTFKGKVYILVNGNTGSTCEPLVYGLKTSGRATVVGERTYGGMLNGERFELSGGSSLWLPTADYYTADGYKIDKNGVCPNFLTKSEDALQKTLNIINEIEIVNMIQ